MISKARAEVCQPAGVALDPKLDRQLVAEVLDGLFSEQDPVAGSGRAPGRPSTLKSEDETLTERWVAMWHMCRNTHLRLSLDAQHFVTMGGRRWTELKGSLALAHWESISRANWSVAVILSSRLWAARAVPQQDLYMFSRPLAISTCRVVILLWLQQWCGSSHDSVRMRRATAVCIF